MATLPLDVHEVLEQEYEARYQSAPPPLPTGALYDADQIIDPTWARSILVDCHLDDPKQTVLALLNALVSNGSGIGNLVDSPVLSQNGVTMVENHAEYEAAAKNKEEVRRRIVDAAFCGAVKSLRDLRLGTLFAALHAKGDDDAARSALCISGGGIRSATFALGVIQGLAGAGILDKFHFLSTVSGGGYIGSWLSSWARRHREGMTGVQKDLVRGDTAVGGTIVNGQPEEKTDVPPSKIDPEAQPVRHLREYSNYLSPRLGLTSADSWTIVALYVRNLLLNLLVLVPILAALISYPRFFAWFLSKVKYAEGIGWLDARYLMTAAIVCIGIGFAYLGSSRPVEHGRKAAKNALFRFSANKRFILGCVVPLTVAAIFLALFWARESTHPNLLERPWFWWHAGVGWFLMIVAPFARYYGRVKRASAADRRDPIGKDASKSLAKKFGAELFAAIAGIVTNAALLFLIAEKVFRFPLHKVTSSQPWIPVLRPLVDSGQISSTYVCVAVPLVLLVFFVQASVFVGLASRVNEEYDREWWGRAGAWLIFFAFVIAVSSVVCVFGPALLYHAPVILGSLGGVSGIVAALVGHSAKTSASKTAEKSTTSSTVSSITSALLVPLFCLVLLAAISLGTTWLFQQFRNTKPPVTTPFEAQFESSAEEKLPVKVGTHTFVQTTVVPKLPAFSKADALTSAHLATIQDTHAYELVFLIALAVVAYLLSKAIGVNRFSMHAFYRNRLIRAYLGASRYGRDPDLFTGFDANDNLQMYELRRDLIWTSHFANAGDFIDTLAKNKAADVAKTIWTSLDAVTQQKIGGGDRDHDVVDSVAQHVNALILDHKLTRAAIDAAFPGQLPPKPAGPMHVVNTTLNLTSGENLAWQQRKGESFTVSPMHCGSFYLGYRDARQYGGPDGISLGNAVTISGAAANPNQGYNSSVPLAFLMTLLNVRLGAWLGNTGVAGGKSFTEAHPDSNLKPLFAELSGSSTDTYDWINLSDGGHFENLALYEMVLRRCRYIVVSDGGCDPTFTFDDLGNAIRKIRTDLGVPIDIEKMAMVPRAEPGAPLKSGSYIATATIRYSAIDGSKPSSDGVLIYLKPSVYEGVFLPRDVYNYAQQSPSFPHEPTSDQFFSESQFESYRALGRHVVNVICGNYKDATAPPPRTPYAAAFDTVAKFARDVAKRAEM